MVPHSVFLTGPYCVRGDAGSGRKVSAQRKTLWAKRVSLLG